MRILSRVIIIQVSIIFAGCSQTNKIESGYAYARNIISGVKPKTSIAENGTVIQKRNDAGIQYFIYIETRDSTFFPVKNIWIMGKEYHAEAEAVVNFPVVLPQNAGASTNYDTLVAAAKFSLWKINAEPVVLPSDAGSTNHPTGKTPDVLIGFSQKGNMHYYSIVKIKYLEPIALE